MAYDPHKDFDGRSFLMSHTIPPDALGHAMVARVVRLRSTHAWCPTCRQVQDLDRAKTDQRCSSTYCRKRDPRSHVLPCVLTEGGTVIVSTAYREAVG